MWFDETHDSHASKFPREFVFAPILTATGETRQLFLLFCGCALHFVCFSPWKWHQPAAFARQLQCRHSEWQDWKFVRLPVNPCSEEENTISKIFSLEVTKSLREMGWVHQVHRPGSFSRADCRISRWSLERNVLDVGNAHKNLFWCPTAKCQTHKKAFWCTGRCFEFHIFSELLIWIRRFYVGFRCLHLCRQSGLISHSPPRRSFSVTGTRSWLLSLAPKCVQTSICFHKGGMASLPGHKSLSKLAQKRCVFPVCHCDHVAQVLRLLRPRHIHLLWENECLLHQPLSLEFPLLCPCLQRWAGFETLCFKQTQIYSQIV